MSPLPRTLPGMGEGPRGAALSAIVLLALLIFRVALIPYGPWEQDDALLARGTADQRELGLILFEVEFVPDLSP